MSLPHAPFVALLGALLISLLACSPGPREDRRPANQDTWEVQDDGWDAIREELQGAFATNPHSIPGIALQVYRPGQDAPVFQTTAGVFDVDARIPVASASKLVSALVFLRLVESEILALDSTTGEVLGWEGTHGQISLDHLNAFVSGLSTETNCAYRPRVPLADCAETIGALPMSSALPGEHFAYSNVHHQVAGRMAEVATGRSWQEVFREHLALPLGLDDPDLRYVTLPRQELGRQPLVGGGLLATTTEYARFLQLILNDGVLDGERLLDAELVGRLRENPYPDAEFVSGPSDFPYGFGSWQHCPRGSETCDVFSSAGAYGFLPWFDFEKGYAAVLAMAAPELRGPGLWSLNLAESLRPLIVEALQEEQREGE